MTTVHDAADKSNGNTPLINTLAVGGERRREAPDALPPSLCTTPISHDYQYTREIKKTYSKNCTYGMACRKCGKQVSSTKAAKEYCDNCLPRSQPSVPGQVGPPSPRGSSLFDHAGPVPATDLPLDDVPRLLHKRALRRRRAAYRKAMWMAFRRQMVFQDMSIEEFKKKALNHCGFSLVGRASAVGIASGSNGTDYCGLQTCGLIWPCATCAAREGSARAGKIVLWVRAWERCGGFVYFLTCTFPHDYGMPLGPMLDLTAQGWTEVLKGPEWMDLKDRLGIDGYIRVIECTDGRCGWHPHVHACFFIDGGKLTKQQEQELEDHIRARWVAWVSSNCICGKRTCQHVRRCACHKSDDVCKESAKTPGHGRYRAPSRQYGVKLESCRSAESAGQYLCKTDAGVNVGYEMARPDRKKGKKANKTYWQLLDIWMDGQEKRDRDGKPAPVDDDVTLRKIVEYVTETKGHRAMTFSGGFEKKLDALVKENLTEEEIAQVIDQFGTTSRELIALIPHDVWKKVRQIEGLDGALLEVAEMFGLAGVNNLLAQYECGQARDPHGLTVDDLIASWRPDP